MEHEVLIEALPLYAAGALDRADRQEVDTHLLTSCPLCHTALKEFQATAASLPYALPPLAPPHTLKAKIIAARTPLSSPPDIDKRPNRPSLEPGEWMRHLFPPTPRLPTWAPLVFGVLGLVFAGSFLYMGYAAYVRTVADSSVSQTLRTEVQDAQQKISGLDRQLRDRDASLAEVRTLLQARESAITDLRETIILREAEIDDLRNQLAQKDKDSGFLRRARMQADEVAGLFRSPSVRAVILEGSEFARDASGLVLYDQFAGRAFLYAYHLPTLPPGKIFQLWAIDGKPIHVGLFGVDAGQKGRLSIKGLAAFSAMTKFMVTLEPDGGRPQPTGPVYLTGTL